MSARIRHTLIASLVVAAVIILAWSIATSMDWDSRGLFGSADPGTTTQANHASSERTSSRGASGAGRSEYTIARGSSTSRPTGKNGTVTVSARCLSATDNQPVVGARMVASWVATKPAAICDVHGDVQLVLEWSPELIMGNPSLVHVEFEASDLERVSREAVIGDGQGTVDFGIVRLAPGSRVEGSVRAHGGASIQGAHVFIARPADNSPGRLETRLWGAGIEALRETGLHSSKTDSEGHFEITGVPHGECAIAVYKSGFEWIVSQQFVLKDDCSMPPLFLQPVAAENRITGVVRDLSGKPVSGARVGLFEDASQPEARPLTRCKTMEETGQFVLPAIDGNLYDLRIDAYGTPLSAATTHEHTVGGISTKSSPVVVCLPASRVVAYRITDGDGAPVKNVSFIGIGKGGRPVRVDVDARDDGYYRVRIPPDVSKLHVGAPMYRWRQQSCGLDVESDTVERIVLERLLGVSGRVIADGKPQANVWVHAHQVGEAGRLFSFAGDLESRLPGNSDQTVKVKTNESGCFELPILAPGRYVLHAEREGMGRSESGVFHVGTREEGVSVDLFMRPTGRIAGNVLVPEGLGNWRAVVAATSGDGHVLTRIVGDRNTSFRFDDVAVGGWQVRLCTEQVKPMLDRELTYRGYDGTWIPDVQVHPSRESSFTLNYSLCVRGRLRGTLLNSARWRVAVMQGRFPRYGSVDEDGAFAVDMLPEGQARIVLSSVGHEPSIRLWRLVELRSALRDLDVELRKAQLAMVGLTPGESYAITGTKGDWFWSARIKAGRGQQAIEIPAGSFEVRGGPGGVHGDVSRWSQLYKGDVSSGARLEVDLRE